MSCKPIKTPHAPNMTNISTKFLTPTKSGEIDISPQRNIVKYSQGKNTSRSRLAKVQYESGNQTNSEDTSTTITPDPDNSNNSIIDSPVTIQGQVESSTGGFKFPDGSVQTTASSGGGTPVAFAASLNFVAAPAPLGTLIPTTVEIDTDSGYNATTGEYTVPSAGIYLAGATLGGLSSSSAPSSYKSIRVSVSRVGLGPLIFSTSGCFISQPGNWAPTVTYVFNMVSGEKIKSSWGTNASSVQLVGIRFWVIKIG